MRVVKRNSLGVALYSRGEGEASWRLRRRVSDAADACARGQARTATKDRSKGVQGVKESSGTREGSRRGANRARRLQFARGRTTTSASEEASGGGERSRGMATMLGTRWIGSRVRR